MKKTITVLNGKDLVALHRLKTNSFRFVFNEKLGFRHVRNNQGCTDTENS